MASNQLTVRDDRTGRSYDLAIEEGAIRAIDLRQIKTTEDDFGLLSYDPGYKNTASTKSAITFIDGERGVLRYRGYPIEQLATESNFLEAAYLILSGELPARDEFNAWADEIGQAALLHKNIASMVDSFRHDAHPMGIFTSTVAALSTFYPEARDVTDADNRRRQIVRLIAKAPGVAAYAYRHSQGLPYVPPDRDLSYTGNFLSMMFKGTELKYEPHPVLERALDMLFVLHLDHEQNCSATTMRTIGSSLADPYLGVAGAAAALSGPRHGGANQAVLAMLRQIGDTSNVPQFIEKVKNRETKLMGFGHRVYKNYDPRAKIVKDTVSKVFEVTGRNPLLDVAIELERIALEDEYFTSRKLYPNVDFYSGIIYEAIGIPTDMFPVLFALSRTVGWLAQWIELLEDDEQKIARPRQLYIGPDERHYLPIDRR